MPVTPLQHITRQFDNAESQLIAALQNYAQAVQSFNENAVGPQLPPQANAGVHGGPDSQTRGRFDDQQILGETALFVLFDMNDGAGGTINGNVPLTPAAAAQLVRKLAK